MNIWVIAKREVLEKRLALVLGPFGILVAMTVPWLNGSSLIKHGDTFAIMHVGVAVATAWGLSSFLGAGLIARDLDERRFGFFLSKPLSIGEILGGKVLGSWIISLFVGALILLPAIWLLRKDWWGIPLVLAVISLGSLFLCFLFHTAATAVRSRSVWILLDLYAITAVTFSGWYNLKRLGEEGAFAAEVWFLPILFSGAFLTLVIGTSLQLSRGRLDLKRGHRILALTLAFGFTVCGAWMFLATHWVLNPKPMVMTSASVIAEGKEWIALEGRIQGWGGLRPVIFHHVASGRYSRPMTCRMDGLQIAADDSRAVWGGWDQGKEGLWVLDLSSRAMEPRFMNMGRGVIHLSPDGKCLLVLDEDLLRIVDLETGVCRNISGFRGEQYSEVLFLSATRARIYGLKHMTGTLEVQELDLLSRKLVDTGRIEDSEKGCNLWVRDRDPKSDHILVSCRARESQSLWLCEGSTGKQLARISEEKNEKGALHVHRASARFLGDGRILMKKEQEGRVLLQLLNAEGNATAHWEMELQSYLPGVPEHSFFTWLAGEKVPGHFWIGVSTEDLNTARYLDADLFSGKVKVVENLQPLVSGSGRNDQWDSTSIHPWLFRSPNGSIVMETAGGLRPLTHPGKFEGLKD